jgi:hypothetical protein
MGLLQNQNPVLGVRDGKLVVVQFNFLRGCEIGKILRRNAWSAFCSNEIWGKGTKRMFQRNSLYDSVTIFPDFY